MTVIESYDRAALQNIAGCLAVRPDKLILVGREENIEDKEALYQWLLTKADLDTQVVTEPIVTDSLLAVTEAFARLVKKNSPCVFDLFGGDPLLLAAAGIVYGQLKDSYDVSMQQLDIEKGFLLDPAGRKTPVDISLSVELTIAMNGGIVAKQPQVDDSCKAADMEKMWQLIGRNPGLWNKKVGILNRFESRAGYKGDDPDIYINGNQFFHTIANIKDDLALFESLLQDLHRCGVIRLQYRNGIQYRYRYQKPFLQNCLKKAGNALEYKTLLEAREYAPGGKPFFNDCAMSAELDWDGIVHSPRSNIKDTKNEVDVIAMQGVIPVFISCKNGTIEEVELYKLHTVAHQLGGEFAKKMLIASRFEADSQASREAFIQRAKDMDILFEPDAALLDKAGWQRLFGQLSQ